MSERATRLTTLLKNLEAIPVHPGQGYSVDDLSTVRYNTSKILQYVIGQEKVYRDVFMKNSCHLDLVLNILEHCCDVTIEQNIILILQELIGKTNVGKRASTLVSHGATHVLFQVLVYESRSQSAPEDLLILIHQLLAKLGPKDRKFGVKARLSQALQVTLSIVKNNTNNPKILQPVLHVLKLYSNNAVNASYLGKNGAVTYLFKLLSVCGKKQLTHSKHALDTLTQLVKSKSNAARAVGHGGVPVLLNMFYDWHRSDAKNRHVALRKSILNVLKHCTTLKAGKKAFTESDGMRILYTTSQETLECQELESVIYLSSLIMRKCFPRNRLPLNVLRSPITCPLPVSDFHILDTNEEQASEENGYESSIDNDDDISSDEDPEVVNKLEAEEQLQERELTEPAPRTFEDLQMYHQFFSELYELDEQAQQEQDSNSKSNIVIPTASCDQNQQPIKNEIKSTNVRGSLSASGLQQSKSSSKASTSRHSLPNMSTAYYNVDTPAQRSSSRTNELMMPSVSPFKSLRRDEKLIYKEENSNGSCDPAVSAVNLKTGASIITLDISSDLSRNTQNQLKGKRSRPTSRGRPPSGSKGQGQGQSNYSASGSRSKSSKQDDWLVGECNPLFITPITTPRERSLEPEASDSDVSPTRTDIEIDNATTTQLLSDPEVFKELARQTYSVGRFNKIPYPELHGHQPPPFKEPQHEKKTGVQRTKIFEDIDRFINPEGIIDRVVYDLDEMVRSVGPAYAGENSVLSNRDAYRISRKEDLSDHLKFNSQFECGNLRKVIQVREYEYDLILNPDVNTNHHHQWFYFEVSNMEANQPYRFNIVNCEKLNSQFNFGMKPVLFSVTEAINKGNAHWVRAGTDICYYKNHFSRSSQVTGGVRGKSYYTGSFNVTFEHERDVCYLAYHYPYSYTMLKTHLHHWEKQIDSSQVYYKNQVICQSIGGNDVNLLTVTAQPRSLDADTLETFKSRPYIFLTGRVHPGESNSSWVMKGTIDYLLSDKPTAQSLRESYIFKIVPMLNPDGVINGCHRCSLTGEDLNRCWLLPCPKLHPTIYHTKGLLQFLAMINKPPLVYCDYHGHSRKKNVFLYGCSPSMSWMPEDIDNPAVATNKVEDTGYKTLPRILQNIAPAFSLNNCSFVVEKAKESTARVVVWRQIGVVRSYTMESTYCGCDQGAYRGQCISTRELEEMGRKFCEGLSKVRSRHIKGAAGVGPGLTASLSGGSCSLLDARLEDDANFEDGGTVCESQAGPVDNLELPPLASNSDSSGGSESEGERFDENDEEEEEEEENAFN